jgi:hypothetical protein
MNGTKMARKWHERKKLQVRNTKVTLIGTLPLIKGIIIHQLPSDIQTKDDLSHNYKEDSY